MDRQIAGLFPRKAMTFVPTLKLDVQLDAVRGIKLRSSGAGSARHPPSFGKRTSGTGLTTGKRRLLSTQRRVPLPRAEKVPVPKSLAEAVTRRATSSGR